MALAGLSAVFLFEMLDNSILNVALPTIGRELHASTVALQWVTGAYAVVFGGLMLAFGALADRVGRRRVMLVGLVLLALASLATAFVTTAEQLIAVRVAMGVAAAMTTPGSMALAFRLFDDDGLRVRAITLISTVGLVGLAIGPTAGGLVLAVAPWQVLLLVNVPIAVLAFLGIRLGVAAGRPERPAPRPGRRRRRRAGHRDDRARPGGADPVRRATGRHRGCRGRPRPAPSPAAILFVLRERTARHPLLDLALSPARSSRAVWRSRPRRASPPPVSATSSPCSFSSTGDGRPRSPPSAMLPQVVVLIAGGAVRRTPSSSGSGSSAPPWLSASAVVVGLAVYALLGRFGYVWVAIALVLVAAGMRVVGVVAGANVLRGLPKERTTIGAALVDTAVGGRLRGRHRRHRHHPRRPVHREHRHRDWSARQAAEFREAVTAAALLTALAAALVGWAALRTHRTPALRETTS